jgi:hypothetical protein
VHDPRGYLTRSSAPSSRPSHAKPKGSNTRRDSAPPPGHSCLYILLPPGILKLTSFDRLQTIKATVSQAVFWFNEVLTLRTPLRSSRKNSLKVLPVRDPGGSPPLWRTGRAAQCRALHLCGVALMRTPDEEPPVVKLGLAATRVKSSI